MKKQFGMIGHLIVQQKNREHFSEMPIGEVFMILNEVDLPAFDALAYFPNFPPQILEGGEPHYSGYLDRNSYEITGSIFEDANLLTIDRLKAKMAIQRHRTLNSGGI